MKKTGKGVNFAGVLPAFAKKLTMEDQLLPIEAEGLN